MRSRRLTEPPRPCGAGVRVCGRGRISCLRARPKDGARLAAFRSPLGNLRASAYKLVSFPTLAGRGAGVRVCGRGRISCLRARPKDGARLAAFRSPLGNLRASAYKLVSFPALAGRGGSVSRRDHSRLPRNRTHLSGGTKPVKPHQAKRQPLFGRGGLGERRFSQRSGLSPSISLQNVSSGGSPGEGLLFREAASPGVSPRSIKEFL